MLGEFYQGIGQERGKVVPKSEAFAYAMAQCGVSLNQAPVPAPCQDEFKEMLEDWFFSGSWIKVNDERIKNL